MSPARRGAMSELRRTHHDMKYGQPMVMHIPKKRGLDVSDINTRTRNAFNLTLATIDASTKKSNFAGTRHG